MRRAGAWLLELLLAASLSFAVALALGLLSRSFYIIGLLPLLIGVLAGAGVGLVALMTGGPWRAAARVAAALAVVVGWGAFQGADDLAFQAAYREDVVRTRGLAEQVPPELLRDPDALSFLGRDAATSLDAEVLAEVGQGGLIGRWRWRARYGVRLVGPLSAGRGLAVGTGGAVAWALLELVLGVALASVVLRRIERAALARAAASA